MAVDDGDAGTRVESTSGSHRLAAVVDRLPFSPAVTALLLVTLGSLLVRLVALGGRIFHWDEGRVGYWILRFDASGQFYYRPIIHGPFLPVVNNYLFDFLPPTDFSARLPVALVGGLLPLAAWLFRERLRDSEVVVLALILAANPLLVYYSRFMRNDVLVGAFSVVTLGLLVRALDTRSPRYFVPALGIFALGFTAKENALLYLLCFLGAGFLLLDHRLVRGAFAGRPVVDTVFGWVTAVEAWFVGAGEGEPVRGVARTAAHAVAALVAFLAVIVFFYAPRPDIWQVFAGQASAIDVVNEATVGSAQKFYGTWASGHHQSHDYLPFFHDMLETLVYGAPVLLVLVPLGLAVDGYLPLADIRARLDGGADAGDGRDRDSKHWRDLVAFATYWGAASLIGYPIATDIQAPWAAVHVVLPLAIPAAVGGAYILREGAQSFEAGDFVGVALAIILVFAAVGGVAWLNVDYFNSASPEDKKVIQWAQPHNDLQDSLEKAEVVARHNDGTDVLFYGTVTPYGDNTLFYVQNESSALQPRVGGPAWHSRLPLPWYLEQYGAVVNSTPPEMSAEAAMRDAPPVVIAYDWNRSDLAPHLDGYTAHEHEFRLWGQRIVVFIDDSALAQARQAK